MKPQEAIKRIKEHNEIHSKKERLAVYITEALNMSIKSLEKQIPRKPLHIHEEYDKHEWKKDENGNVDEWAFEQGLCAGVVCERCGESVCVWCEPDYDKGKCVVKKDVCPNCNSEVTKQYKHCPECRQKLEWEVKNDKR